MIMAKVYLNERPEIPTGSSIITTNSATISTTSSPTQTSVSTNSYTDFEMLRQVYILRYGLNSKWFQCMPMEWKWKQ